MKTYGDLKTAIADYLEREDLTGTIPTFVRLAEDRMFRKLRIRENEFHIQLTQADDPFNPIQLPDNYREMKLLCVNDGPVQRISDEEYYARTKGYDREWNILDDMCFTTLERKLYIFPWPDETRTEEEWGEVKVDIHYYGTESLGEMAVWNTPTNPNQIPESAGAAPATSMRPEEATNRLLQVAFDAYLFGSVAEGYRYLREPQKMMEYRQFADEVIAELNYESDEAEYAGGTVAVSNTVPDRVLRYRR